MLGPWRATQYMVQWNGNSVYFYSGMKVEKGYLESS